MPLAQTQRILQQIESLFDLKAEEAVLVSAKTGHNVDQLLHAIIQRVPPPTARRDAPLRLLLFDSWFDNYRGVVCLMEVMDGQVRAGDVLVSAHAQEAFEVQEVGILYPNPLPVEALEAGQVGYVITSMRRREQALVGDTFFRKGVPVPALPGFQPPKSMVFAGLYPVEQVSSR